MAFSEKRVLNQVTILPELSAVNVQWLDQVLRDDEVIASNPYRKGYTVDQKEEFLAEVEQAEHYITILGW
jgi:hypothetical protein